jgi:hypothetical protein
MDKPPYKVEIDFDGASVAWRKNKKKLGGYFHWGGSFEYVCGLPRKSDGKPCQGHPKKWCKSRRPKDGTFMRDWGPCRHHA